MKTKTMYLVNEYMPNPVEEVEFLRETPKCIYIKQARWGEQRQPKEYRDGKYRFLFDAREDAYRVAIERMQSRLFHTEEEAKLLTGRIAYLQYVLEEMS